MSRWSLDSLLSWGPLQAHDSMPFHFLVHAVSWGGGPGHPEMLTPHR